MSGCQETSWITAQRNTQRKTTSTTLTSNTFAQQWCTPKRERSSPSTKSSYTTLTLKYGRHGRQIWKRSRTHGPIFVMNRAQIAKMYVEDKTPTYTRIVVDFRPQKSDPSRVRITAGGNLIKCPGELTTRTADITTTKII